MKRVYTTYLHIIRNNCCKDSSPVTVHEEDLESLLQLAERHFTSSFLMPYINSKYTNICQALKKQLKMLLYNYYQIEHFTKKIVTLFDQNNIPCFLLKGLSLAAYYPDPEYRKLGDVDLYINDPEALKRAKSLLLANGFQEEDELSDHHLTYRYTFPKTGRTYLLELHYHIVGVYQYENANLVVNSVFSEENLKSELQTIEGYTYHVLPPTEYTFYMIHHMLKHYLYSGFGIRLLCDFTFYLTAHADDIDFGKIHKWCENSRIMHLYEIIIESCRIYLGLSSQIDPDIRYNKEDCEIFIEKILAERDVGSPDGTTLVSGGSYQNVHLGTYFKEGHLQMKVRFPKLSRCPLIWPVLWGITFYCFLRNTYKLRGTTLRATLKAFKKHNQETQLIQIFDNADSSNRR